LVEKLIDNELKKNNSKKITKIREEEGEDESWEEETKVQTKK
jgi:shikimate kinase